MDSLHKAISSRERAAALIIVLALVVLVTGLVVAYFSRATSDRPVAHSSFNQSKVDQLAQSAMDSIIGDLRQEITNGSASPAPTFGPASIPGPFNLYVPTSSANILPMRSPIQAVMPNLIRRSVSPDAIPSPARPSRASAVNSTSDVSANGRSVSLARWNSHYLIPKSNTGDDKTDPITTGFSAPSYWAPDWVFVTNNGATVIAQSDNSVIGRYAYAIYDEGGLVDLNAAGYPSPTTILQYGRKGSLAFADLTGLGSFGLSTTGINNIVGWRNYASSQPTGTFSPTPNFSFSTNATNTYYDFILSDPNFIQLTNFLPNTPTPLTYFPNYFLTTAWQAPQYNNQTDQAFATRQELLTFRKTTGFSSNALQYLGTLSREALASVPQWTGPSPTPTSINPNFQTLLVTTAFTRNDGTTANVGDYLVDKRFLLQRLNWLTYLGPSALRTIPGSAPAIGNQNYDMWLLTRPNGITFGLTSAFLLQGTAANILKYFGLVWDATNQRWNYTGPAGGSLASSIATLGTLTATREPDFFELLQAGILSGSLGDAFSSNPALPLVHQQSTMLHILTIGANLIAQSRVDSYPVRIACSVNGTTMEAVGMPRLPCLSSLAACPVGVTQTSGGLNWFLIPNLWDPFRDTWDLTEAHAGNNTSGANTIWLTPGYLRPPVRITITGGVGFGAATASQSGSVDPASVATFSTLTIPPSLSLTLATGNSVFGRDGLREALRLGTSDISTSVTAFDPATLGSSTPSWNSIVPPTSDGSPYRTDNFVVFRLSLLGSGITSPTGRPVLILQPGFQVRMEYQSPNLQWYPYSFLQGVGPDATNNTWISTNLDLATTFSQYGTPTGYTFPTVVNSGTTTRTPWMVTALAQAPMFAKADPRSIRYNSQVGVVNLLSPPMSFLSAGIIGSIWPDTRAAPPNTYVTPPPMSPSGFPIPTPTPNANPATYSQLGDNGPAGSNPYNEFIPVGQTNSIGDAVRPIVMNRPFRSVGEMGYAFRGQPFRTLSFSSTNSPDAGLLDLFSTNAAGPTPTPSPTPSASPITPTPTPTPRGGVISLNSRQAPAIAAVLASTIRREDTPRVNAGSAQSPSPLPLSATDATNSVTTLVSLTSAGPVKNKADLATLIANVNPVGFDVTVPKTERELIARALGEAVQTRTWNLMIDVIAQSGRYPPNATSFRNGFVVEGEQRYWVHVAIDRFTGQVIDKRIEVVNE
jgi:hypothetical protein